MIDHRTSHAPDRVPRPLSERLKAETRDEHRRAETHPLMAAMVSGRIDRAMYARYLGQMRHVHATLDAALRAGAQKHGALAVVVHEQYLHEPAIRADLATLGEHADGHPPLAATGLFCGRISALAEDDAVALLGTFYVLEGSTNGGRFIAPAVRKALDLPATGGPGSGTEYFEPHGERQRERWSYFKAALDILTLPASECDLIVAVAVDAFRGVHDIFEDLMHPPASSRGDPSRPGPVVEFPARAGEEAPTHPTE